MSQIVKLALIIPIGGCSSPIHSRDLPTESSGGFDEAGGQHTGTGTFDTGVETTTGTNITDTGEPPTNSPCPDEMVLVADVFCIDRFEAAVEEWDGHVWSPASPYATIAGRTVRAIPAAGIVPQGYISGDEAASACALAGKSLCTSTQWLQACQGPDAWVYPYGNNHVASACNDNYVGHPVVDYFGTATGVWDGAHMNDSGINQQSDTVAVGGAHQDCMSAWGAYDLHGNLHEWIEDPNGTFRGGFYADAAINGSGCLYVTTAHSTPYHDYSTGFRCCAEPY